MNYDIDINNYVMDTKYIIILIHIFLINLIYAFFLNSNLLGHTPFLWDFYSCSLLFLYFIYSQYL